ncbi:inositol polyphosphate 4-phosphatase type II [Echinops telfairi]|uniref:Inositol polyphosphate 4-phosphatase type II n=1 Tax=Echinops telfairi TaxID=9371 RepID=A0AC55DCL8_ECHTE|nr:inositol polyphosphate 4-phosphatase type II [Echinops telfairi]
MSCKCACKDLVAPVRDGKLNTLVQISVIHPEEPSLTRYSSTEVVEGTRDPLFLTGVTFPSEYPIYEETKIKLTVYDVKDKSHDTLRTSVLPAQKDPPPEVGRSFLGYASFKVGELLKSKEQLLALSLRCSYLNECALVCECTAPENVSSKDHLPFLNAVLTNPVCKLYRFPTSDNKWMRIREQMSESILSFHIPKELISLHIKEDLYAIYDVITVGAPAAHFQGFKNGGLRKLLHRFETERRNTEYQFIYYSPENTAKAKAVLSNINQLQPLIAAHADLLLNSASQHSPESLKNSLKMLSEKTELFVHAFKDQLVRSSLLALYNARPGGVLKKPPSPQRLVEEGRPQDQPPPIRRQDSIPHHSDYDEEEWDRVWASVGKSLNCIIAMVDRLTERDGGSEGSGSTSQDGEKELLPAGAIMPQSQEDWYEQLHPLILTLKDCMGEVVSRAKQSLTFVLLQELAYSLPQCLMLTLRRDIVFSQALAGLVCGVIIKLHTSLDDPGFLDQLHTIGLIVQYEGLLSTYSDEIGMLEDMAVGISDLKKVAFRITEAKSNDVLPVITGRREHYVVEVKLPARMFESLPLQIKEGQLLHVYPVLFNVGINEQQTLAERFGDVSLQESINQENFELLKEYYEMFMEKMPPDYISHFQEQNDLKGLLENLHQNIQAKKRKNVEIMWLAATICRKLNGIRFTCCKSAKDRTSMSVTLEQCSVLRDEHQLHKDFFIRALDCMRSKHTQGALNESDDPETGCLTDNKPTSRHFYPVALLLVSSHLLVVWLILSLALLLAKYQ